MHRRWALLGLVMAACGEPSPRAPRPAAPSPPALEATDVTDIGSPRVFVLPVSNRGALLFQSELPDLREAATEGLSTQRTRPVRPLSRTEIDNLEIVRAERRARRDGPECRRMPSLGRVVLANYPDVLTAVPEATCFDGCRATISIRRPRRPFVGLGAGNEVFRIESPVADPERAASYEAAFRTLTPGPARPLETVDLPPSGGDAEILSIVLGPRVSDGFFQLPPYLTCGYSVLTALIQLNAAGTVTGCELDDPDMSICDFCRRMTAVEQPKGRDGRRARISFRARFNQSQGWVSVGSMGPQRPRTTRGALVAEDDDEALEEATRALHHCIPNPKAKTPADVGSLPYRADLAIARGPDGTVQSVAVKASSGLDIGELVCIEQAIRSVSFTCPIDEAPLDLLVKGERHYAY